jgi:hypothetical protein
MSDPDSYAPLGPHSLTPGGNQKDLIDPTGAMIAIDFNHHEIHEGDFYSFGYTFIDVASTAFAYLRFLTGAKEFHYGIEIDTEGKAYAFLYRGTTYTLDGTTVALINNNCGSSNTALTTAFFTPTPDAFGTLLTPPNGILIPGGLGPQSIGGSVKSNEERVGAVSGDYLIAVQNVSGLAKDITIQVAGYEETPIT